MKYRGEGPVFRLYGITQSGNSVLAHIYGFRPYFYIRVPEDFGDQHIETFQKTLNEIVLKNCPRTHLQHFSESNEPELILNVERTKQSSIYGYQESKLYNFLKITLAIPQVMPTARKALENNTGIHINNYGRIQTNVTYETNIDFETRFMVDTLLMGCNWIELKAGMFQQRKVPMSHCQIELETTWDGFISHNPEEGCFLTLFLYL